jgi:hypothetical protein
MFRRSLFIWTMPILLVGIVPAFAQTGILSLSSGAGALDTAYWQTATQLLVDLGRSQGTKWVNPQLTFDNSGMKMGGVNGTFQFTGLQSKATFTPPFSVHAQVMGLVANGNAFSFLIVSPDLQQSLRIEGNLNPRNGPYRGLWTTGGEDAGSNVLPDVRTGIWYGLTISVDRNGTASFTVTDTTGRVLGTKSDLHVGLGPFFIILGQREGEPYTVGSNVAQWSKVAVSPTSETSTSHGDAIDAPVGANIRSVDFLNFDYRSSCRDGLTHVSKGEWKGADNTWFKVVKVIYGNILGNHDGQAAIHTMAYTGGNFACNEVYVFTMNSGKPEILERLTLDDWGKGEESNGSMFQVTGLTVANQQLAIAFLAGGSHACPAWDVTANFQWRGHAFVRTAVAQTPHKCR